MASNVKINWKLKEAIRTTTNIIRQGELKFAEILKEEINKEAPGSIGDHTEIQVTLRGIKVMNDHPAAAFVEFGTPPHKILGSPLRWVDEGTGETIFAFEVNHPGTRPNPFFRRGIARAKTRAVQTFGQQASVAARLQRLLSASSGTMHEGLFIP